MTNKIRHSLYFLREELDNYAAPGELCPTLDVDTNPGIISELIECLYDFQQEWNKKPTGFLLSPVAFLQFRHELNRRPWGDLTGQLPPKFEDIPIFCADISYRVLPILPEYLVPSYEWKRRQNQRGYT